MTTASSLRSGPQPGLPGLWLRGWSHAALLVLNLLTGALSLVLVLALVVGTLGIVLAGAGLLLVVPALWGARLFARLEPDRVAAFTGHHITPRSWPEPTTGLQRLGWSAEHRRAAAYTGVHALWGVFIGTLSTMVLSSLVGLLALPLYADRLPRQGTQVLGLLPLETTSGWVLLWVAALAGLLVVPFVAPLLTQVDLQVVRGLLGQDPEEEIAELSERVETLTSSRTQTVDSVEAERRRIERDLHDGPQQRLVAIAMDLGMARQRLAQDPQGAGELLERAHAGAKEAIVEMRHVARGITPPVLADRGLDAAVSALAARSAVPVHVEADEVPRLDPTTEAIGYYCVSELLTNVTKHSRAQQAWVHLWVQQEQNRAMLLLEVTDDGIGGADPARGTGLLGLRQRAASVDGTLTVHSPAAGPTRVLVRLPARSITPRERL